MYKHLKEEQVKDIRDKWIDGVFLLKDGTIDMTLDDIADFFLNEFDSHLGRAMEERSRGIVDECIAIVVNNSIPSNDQMIIVREIRKLLSTLTPPKGE